ncbi:MAG: hypothetical protein IJ587_01340 [Synergistaceae bacterium]|nr:hypothetical protein [Synergistaceae bacterium]
MSNSYVINGKEYAEAKIITLYDFWQEHCDMEDIEDAMEHVIKNFEASEIVDFVLNNADKIRGICKKHILYWHNLQESTLSASEATIFYLAQQLIDCIYYDSERKMPHRAKSKSSEELPF